MTPLSGARASGNQQLGVLISSTPVRLLEISRTGCLLESDRRLDEGVAGEFRVEIDGRPNSEEVRITRCVRLDGSGSRYRVGAEFLRTRPLGSGSLRGAVGALDMVGGSALLASLRLTLPNGRG